MTYYALIGDVSALDISHGVKGFADLNQQEWKETIGGAIFLIGCVVIFFVFAYFFWEQHKD